MNSVQPSKKILLFLFLFLFTFINSTEALEKKNSANESLKFSINTGSEEGFVYLIYVDKKRGTSLLYPNEKTIEKKKMGKLKFPEDFEGKDINTTKDCKNCKKEKTTIFVLLSDDPIENIQNMNEKNLKNIQIKQKDKSKGILLNKEKPVLLVDKIDFFVK
ncbi:MAG: Unknown protein [uncultured Sulfurovum sp.]|uniref:DUF4384 domain-containing protein n=1 Tax=uncultured Sulfurovum sp. TaxID=269237 RepID=A0A6S6SK38_9BACT|nr:MAG: Unknown protein [uncultured Sulfurovum sp.]